MKTWNEASLSALKLVLKERGCSVKIRGYGRSMGRLIKKDCQLVVTDFFNQLHIGDVVVFRHRDSLIVHRIVAIKSDNSRSLYLAKGDARPHYDKYISEEFILGKVVRIIHGSQTIELNTYWSRFLGKIIAFVSLWEAHANMAITRHTTRITLKAIAARTISFLSSPCINFLSICTLIATSASDNSENHMLVGCD